MVDINLTPIEEKKKIVNKESKGNNWRGFGLSIIGNILLTLIIGLSGANFIFLTRAATINDIGQQIPTIVDDNEQIIFDSSKPSLLDKLMPTDESWYFNKAPTPKSLTPNKDYTHWNNLNSIGVTKKHNGWPYSMYKEYTEDELEHWWNKTNWWQNFKNWFAQSIATSYIQNRTLMKNWLRLFAPVVDSKTGKNMNIFSNNTFQMLGVSPLMYIIFPLLMFVIFASIFVATFSNGWWKRALIGCFLYYTLFITYGVSIVQSIQYFFTFLLVPLMANHNIVKNIISETSGTLLTIFMILMCVSSFSNLDEKLAWGFTGGYIGLLILGLIVSKMK